MSDCKKVTSPKKEFASPEKKFASPEEWPPATNGQDQATVWEGPYKGDWIWFDGKWQRLTDELMAKIREHWNDILGDV